MQLAASTEEDIPVSILYVITRACLGHELLCEGLIFGHFFRNQTAVEAHWLIVDYKSLRVGAVWNFRVS